ncbi:glycoside hydrolase family 3 protein [Streptomyces bambusae]|uniref:glycoside hydrolase family 3 protein n=1 Tax=Streptomyces bambusae TaxID=1550616 RepID=UPI001CFFEF6E|nr:glycoside hydrolase family 3 protein [Streptomyces bambusae]MCB5169272.1 glycoside hydrolase family 3 protein [Streptomyces bambusae]
MPYHASRRLLLAAAALAALPAAGSASAAGTRRPAPVTGPARLAARMSLAEKVGQLFVTRVYGHSATAPDPADAESNLAHFGVRTAAEVVSAYHVGGIVYFGWAHNTRSPQLVAELSEGLQRAALAGPSGIPLLLSVDQEHGAVARIGRPATLFPGAMALGAAGDAAGAREAARIAGAELAALGIRQDYAPVADVNVNPANPVIGVRSFGSDPRAVAELVAAQVRGYQESGIAATAKHFPGHGDTETDSHVGLPVMRHTRAQWEELDEPPFRAAVRAGADAVMTAHIVFPALDPSGDPATLSRPIVTGLLRERLGFRGVVVTDALDMAGVRQKYGDDRVPVLALKAGCDQLLNPPDLRLAIRSVLAAVRSGELTEDRIDASLLRILELKLRRGLFAGPLPRPGEVPAAVGTAEHLAAADAIAAGTTTLLADPDGLLPLSPAVRPRLLVTGADPGSPSGTTGPPTAALARELAALGFTTQTVPTGTAPTEAAVAAAVAAARGQDAVVVLTYNVPVAEAASGGQYALVQRLVDTGVPVVALAVRNPYDAARLPRTAAALASYAWTDVELRAAARVLAGRTSPSGRLPVPVPGAYPLGHGLTY